MNSSSGSSLASPDATRPRVRLGRDSGLNLLGQGLPLVVALGTMPVVVRGLGPAQFGLLALTWTIVGYAGTFDLGLGRAATKRVSEAAWAGDAGRVRSIAATAAAAHAAFGLLTGLLLWLLAPVAGRLLVPSGGVAAVQAADLMRLLALALPAVLLSNAYRAVLEGLHRFGLVNAGRAPLSGAMFLVPFAGVVAGADLTVIVAWLVAARYGGAVLFAVLYAVAAPRGARGSPGMAELGDLLRFGGWVAVSNMVIPVVVYLERFVVSALRGPVALAFYAAPQELVTRLNLLPAAVAGVLFPTFSGLATDGNGAELLRRIRQGVRIIALLLVPPVAVLILVAGPLLTVWLGPDYGEQSATVMRLLAFALFLAGVAFVPFTLVEGVGRPDIVAKYHLVELPVYAAVLWFLVGRYGAVGAALAWALRMSVTAPLFFIVALRAARVPLRAALDGSTGHTVTVSLACLAAAGTLQALLPPLLQVGTAAVLTALFAGVAWLWLLEDQDRAAVMDIARRFRRSPDIEHYATDG